MRANSQKTDPKKSALTQAVVQAIQKEKRGVLVSAFINTVRNISSEGWQTERDAWFEQLRTRPELINPEEIETLKNEFSSWVDEYCIERPNVLNAEQKKLLTEKIMYDSVMDPHVDTPKSPPVIHLSSFCGDQFRNDFLVGGMTLRKYVMTCSEEKFVELAAAFHSGEPISRETMIAELYDSNLTDEKRKRNAGIIRHWIADGLSFDINDPKIDQVIMGYNQKLQEAALAAIPSVYRTSVTDANSAEGFSISPNPFYGSFEKNAASNIVFVVTTVPYFCIQSENNSSKQLPVARVTCRYVLEDSRYQLTDFDCVALRTKDKVLAEQYKILLETQKSIEEKDAAYDALFYHTDQSGRTVAANTILGLAGEIYKHLSQGNLEEVMKQYLQLGEVISDEFFKKTKKENYTEQNVFQFVREQCPDLKITSELSNAVLESLLITQGAAVASPKDKTHVDLGRAFFAGLTVCQSNECLADQLDRHRPDVQEALSAKYDDHEKQLVNTVPCNAWNAKIQGDFTDSLARNAFQQHFITYQIEHAREIRQIQVSKNFDEPIVAPESVTEKKSENIVHAGKSDQSSQKNNIGNFHRQFIENIKQLILDTKWDVGVHAFALKSRSGVAINVTDENGGVRKYTVPKNVAMMYQICQSMSPDMSPDAFAESFNKLRDIGAKAATHGQYGSFFSSRSKETQEFYDKFAKEAVNVVSIAPC
jgi:hypothetical protein